MENNPDQATTATQEEKLPENIKQESQVSNQESEGYYDDGNNQEEEEEEEDENDPYDFSIDNKKMKTKKFKNKPPQTQDIDDEYEAEGEIEEVGEDGKTNRVFKGADKIFNQIKWDEKYNKNDFIVGYVDRFEGNLEEPFTTFETLKEDIPYHRIRYFKKQGEIVWERKKKVNKL
jgi:uncharacterized protein (UPF0248 family)